MVDVVVRAEEGEDEDVDDMVVVAVVAPAVGVVVPPPPDAFVVMDDIMLLKLPLRKREMVHNKYDAYRISWNTMGDGTSRKNSL